MATLLRALLSTALVLGLMLYIARAIRKPGSLTAKLRLPAANSLIVSRTAVNRTTTLAVVRFGGKEHLIAASETNTQVLATTDIALAVEDAPTVVTSGEGDAQLQALRNTLKPTTFADVLRGYTARRTVEQL
jgi:hypothetical protein